jgi:hypothetical protein
MTDRKSRPPILDVPISPPSLLDKDFNARFRADVDNRWDALFEHYDIDRADPNAWMDMSIELAKEHVPGFSVERARLKPNPGNPDERRGKPPKFNARVIPLAAFTVLYRRKHGCTENRVSKIVSQGDKGLLPVSDRWVREIFRSREFQALAFLMESWVEDVGDERLANTVLEDNEILGTAAPWSKWKKILGTY